MGTNVGVPTEDVDKVLPISKSSVLIHIDAAYSKYRNVVQQHHPVQCIDCGRAEDRDESKPETLTLDVITELRLQHLCYEDHCLLRHLRRSQFGRVHQEIVDVIIRIGIGLVRIRPMDGVRRAYLGPKHTGVLEVLCSVWQCFHRSVLIRRGGWCW